MSIKTKTSLYITLVVAIVLSLNNLIFYYSVKDGLERELVSQTEKVSLDIAESISRSRFASSYIEELLADKLRLAALMASKELAPDIAKVSNEQLKELSGKLGVSHISLLVMSGNDIVIAKSSDPKEIGMGTSGWGYWYTAFQELFDRRDVSVALGQKAEHFWAGPFDYAASSPDHIDKYGYYYDGNSSYIIDPYLRDEEIRDFKKIVGPDDILARASKLYPSIIEIAGFDPARFGEDPKLREKDGTGIASLANRPLLFGSYELKDEASDRQHMRQAVQSKQTVTVRSVSGERQIVRSFIPIEGDQPYVISIASSYDSVKKTLSELLLRHISISIGLLLAVFALSFAIASFFIKPLLRIVTMVGEIAEGNFHARVPLRGRDEFTLLGSRIHTMSEKLERNTDRMEEALEELRSTREYMESFFNHTSDAIHVTDLAGCVLLVNKAFETLYGWKREEVQNRPLPVIPEQAWEEMADIGLKLQQGGFISGHETVFQVKGGRLIDVNVSISGIPDENGEIVAFVSVSRNITERKQTEELIRRSEKLSVVGQLAAGVAHEIRNPLTTLRGFMQLQKAKQDGNPSHLELMLSELDRINFIVSEFLILAKPQVTQFQQRDLAQIVGDILLLLDSQANMRNIVFKTSIDPDIPPIKCEENQLKQVLVNVLKNGIESMEDGGEISIEVRRIDPNRVMVRIIDHGCGIPEEHLARLGEPFFTNKETGTGLGIMVCQQIIANHKGNMLIRSEIGKGTCVDIVLPVQF